MISKFKKSKKGSPLQTLFFSILLGFLFLFVFGFLVFSNWKISQRRAELMTRIEELKKEIQVLEEKNQELQTGISQTQKEDYWKEKLYEQGYVEKGERQLVVLPPKEEKPEEKPEKNLWNPQNWWDWIKEKISR